MKYLLVVDLQSEFVKDKQGQKIYDNCLNYIAMHHNEYNAILAAVYQNKGNVNMDRLVDWNECKTVKALDFVPDAIYYHGGYSIKEYPYVNVGDTIDIIGFDTDACVLSACFHVFDLGCNMRILSDLCWSSGGKKMHEAGLNIMKRQFKNAVI